MEKGILKWKKTFKNLKKRFQINKKSLFKIKKAFKKNKKINFKI